MTVTSQISFRKATEEEYLRCEQVLGQAKKRWLYVLYLFAAGLHPQEVADRLRLSRKTVDTYNTHLLELCRSAWDMRPDKYLDYHFLCEKFAKHFNSM